MPSLLEEAMDPEELERARKQERESVGANWDAISNWVMYGSPEGDITKTPATRELEQAGSVMAREPYQPGRLGLAGDILREGLETLNPLNWMGGFGKASIPLGLWKALPEEAKAAASITANQYPALFKQVLDLPTPVVTRVVPEALLGSRGLYQKVPDLLGELIGYASVTPKRAKVGKVLGHEYQHYATEELGKAKIDPQHALENAGLIFDQLPAKYRGSLHNVLDELGFTPTKIGEETRLHHYAGRPSMLSKQGEAALSPQWFPEFTVGAQRAATQKRLAKLPPEIRKSLIDEENKYQATLKEIGAPGYTGNKPDSAPTMAATKAQLAFDEALSYLGNAVSDPKTTNPILEKLARYFGIDWRGKELPIKGSER